jgi:hypothetical protein
MQRIYVSDLDIKQENITIKDADIVHQLTKVLRIRV